MSKTIHLSVKEAKGVLQKSIGLINKEPQALLLRTRWGIHTFGMKYPIDVVILDSSYTVKILKKNLLPYQIFMWNPKYSYVLELPAQTIQSEHISLGSSIVLTFV